MSAPPPRFTLAQLQYFVAAADAGGISAAAELLHTSQSGMSSAIQRLERDLRCDLFIRNHARGITLTADGRELLSRARELLHQAAELQEASENLRGAVSGRLNAGFFVTLAPLFVPQVLHRLRSLHSALDVRIQEGDGVTLHAALRSGDCDVALTYGLDVGDDMLFEPVTQAQLYALVSARHPLAGQSRATLRQLAVTAMIMLDLPETGRQMTAMLDKLGVTPPEIIRTTSFETMRALVAAGDGFAILNQRLAAPAMADGAVTAITVSDAEFVSVGLLRVASVRPTRRVQVFSQECRSIARALSAPAHRQPPTAEPA